MNIRLYAISSSVIQYASTKKLHWIRCNDSLFTTKIKVVFKASKTFTSRATNQIASLGVTRRIHKSLLSETLRVVLHSLPLYVDFFFCCHQEQEGKTRNFNFRYTDIIVIQQKHYLSVLMIKFRVLSFRPQGKM